MLTVITFHLRSAKKTTFLFFSRWRFTRVKNISAQNANSANNQVKPSPVEQNKKPILEIKSLTKNFSNFTAVNNVDLTIYEGEIFALLGSSGCGKSTLLRMLAGFEHPSAGHIILKHDVPVICSIPIYDCKTEYRFWSKAGKITKRCYQ